MRTTPTTSLLPLLLLALAAAPACGGTATPDDTGPAGGGGDQELTSTLERDTDPQVDEQTVDQQVAGNTAFAVDLYKEVAPADQDNLIYSPYSVSLALAMTWAGARGETEQAMAQTMHYALGQDELHPVFNYLDLELASRGQGAAGADGEPFRLRIANSLWGQAGYPFLDAFLDTLAVNYGAGLRVLDFEADPNGSREQINGWVEKQTDERIKDLLPEGSITPGTRLVLTNAIYFNAAWASPFDEASTSPGTFTTLDGQSVQVDMMHHSEQWRYAEQGGLQAVELPYEGGEVSMVVVLPTDFASFEQGLDAATLDALFSALAPAQVTLAMPKFEFEKSLSLTETLQAMGMEVAFSSQADFTGMVDNANLAITDVLHKAFIKLNEKGTEAAAATAVVVGETSAPQVQAGVVLDRPFFFAIRDNATGTVLFAGRVADPS